MALNAVIRRLMAYCIYNTCTAPRVTRSLACLLQLQHALRRFDAICGVVSIYNANPECELIISDVACSWMWA